MRPFSRREGRGDGNRGACRVAGWFPRPTEPAPEHWRRIDEYLRARLREDLYDRWFAPLRVIGLDGDRLQVGAPDTFHRDFVDDNYRDWFDEFVPGAGRRAGAHAVRRGRPPAPPRPPPAAEPAPAFAAPPGARRDPPQPPLPLRHLRGRRVEPLRRRRRPGGGPEARATPGTRSSSTATPASARPTCSTPSPTPSSRPPRARRVAIVTSERYTNDFVDALRQRHHGRVPPQVPRVRRAARRRRAVLRRRGQDRRGVLPHLQHPLRAERADRPLQRPQPQGAEGAGGAALLPLRVGHAGADRRPRVRDPRRHPQEEGAELEQIDLPDEVASLLATHISRTSASWTAPSCALAAFASLKGEPISRARWPATSSPTSSRRPATSPSIERIQEAVAAHYGLTVAKLTSASREQKIALPRQVAMFLCRELAKETLPAHRREVQQEGPLHRHLGQGAGRRAARSPTRRSSRRSTPSRQKLAPRRGERVDRPWITPWIGAGSGVGAVVDTSIGRTLHKSARAVIRRVLQIGFPSHSAGATRFSTSIAPCYDRDGSKER